MRRRDFITVLGGAAARPLAARGQQAQTVRRIGVLTALAEDDIANEANGVSKFTRLGWIEGRR